MLNNELILKLQQRFQSEAHNVYTEEVNKIALSSNDDKRLQACDGITTYPYGYKHWQSMYNRHIKKSKYKMINFDSYTSENKTEHNLKWPYIPDRPYRILIITGSLSRKTNALLNLINNQPNIDKIYPYANYAKDLYEAKY